MTNTRPALLIKRIELVLKNDHISALVTDETDKYINLGFIHHLQWDIDPSKVETLAETIKREVVNIIANYTNSARLVQEHLDTLE